MPALPAINNLRTALSLPLSAIDTVATVAFTTGFPNTGIFSVEDEIIAYTGRTPTTFTGLTRGYDGSIATTHVAGLTCGLRIIAKHLNDAAFINPLPTTVDVGGIPAGMTFPARVTVQEVIDRLLYPSDDTYPTHDAVRGKGGLTHALTTAARDAISVYRRRAGMLCYVDETGLTYQLQPDLTTWTPFPLGPPSGYIVGLPISTLVLDSVDPSLYGTVKWAVEIRKGTRRLVFEIVASHDGATASEMRPVSMQLGTGLFDITVAATLVPGSPTGSLEISVTPASWGWSISWQRIYTLPWLPPPPTAFLVYNIPTDTYNLPTTIYGA